VSLLARNIMLAIEGAANDDDKTILVGNGHASAPLRRDGPAGSPGDSCCEHRGDAQPM
jgi:hypothetical protein